MKISVITVSYNSAATIGDTLRSVAAQTYPHVEHLVIDGGSKDATMDVVREHGSHVATVVSERDKGIYDAMNKGLAMATGDVVGFLNSDDMLADVDALARIAAGMEDSAVDAVYGDLVFVAPTDLQQVVRYWRPGDHRSGLCARGWMAPHPTFYVRRLVLAASGGFSLDYRLAADFELMLRLFEVKLIRSKYLPVTLVRMRMGGATTGSIRNVLHGNIEASRACRNNGFRGGIPFILSKITSRIPQFLSRPARS